MHLKDIPNALSELRARDRLRVPDDSLERLRLEKEFGSDFIDAASNDYLGLSGRSGERAIGEAPREPLGVFASSLDRGSRDVSRETGVQGRRGNIVSRETVKVASEGVSRETDVQDHLESDPGCAPAGAGSSRLIFGSHSEHLSLEREVAEWLGYRSSLFFPSGYSANVGALGALLSPEDAVFSDRLNHASLIDGIRLSRARPHVFSHLDLRDLEEGLRRAASAPSRWVLVESYYSMDGDGPDLSALRALCDSHDAHLYVDEAHSVGTFGPEGKGLCAEVGVEADVLMAAFGKSVGSQGACVLGSEEIRTWMWNRARSFVFSTGPSPLLAQSLRDQIRKTREADSQRARLQQICEQVRMNLKEEGVGLVQGSFGPVLSLPLGEESRALAFAQSLRERGILAQAVRPPTVPDGESRVRLVLRSSFTEEQISRLCSLVARETSST